MHKNKIWDNSLIGFIFTIMMSAIGFISRKIFIVFLGEEILGLNSLYANILDLLNLAELGIGVAAQYQLYEALVRKDYDKQSKIISAVRKIYNKIGIVILFLGVAVSFLIPNLIKESTYFASYIRVSFLISVTGVALGYFFVHERLYLQADEELGLVNIIDLVVKIITTVISLILMIFLKNYFIFLAVNVLYSISANLIIHFIFKKKYPSISSKRNDDETESKALTTNLKTVVPLKLSDYVYKSTDNVIISKVLGLQTVARYSNYMAIINVIMGLEYSLGSVVMSSLGKIIKECDDKKEIYKYYLLFCYVQFLLTNLCTVSLAILMPTVIKMWIGGEYLIGKEVFVFLIINFFIHSMYQPANVVYGATGKFKEDKYITMVSALINIFVSMFLVLALGLSGVVLGTIITDIYILCVRSYQIVGLYFKADLRNYGLLVVRYTIITLIGLGISFFLSNQIITNHLLVEFVLKGGICVFIPNVLAIIGTSHLEEFGNLLEVVKIKLGRK